MTFKRNVADPDHGDYVAPALLLLITTKKIYENQLIIFVFACYYKIPIWTLLF
jgi:hypothetical protein